MPLKFIPELSSTNFPSDAGIYVISADPPTKRGARLVKIGRSIHMRKRLNDYHICFPNGFHIWMVIKLAPGVNKKVTKKQLINVTASLERRVFAEIINLNLVNDARRFHEYFTITTKADMETLKESIERVTMNFQPVTEWPPITEWVQGTKYDEFLIDGEQVVL